MRNLLGVLLFFCCPLFGQVVQYGKVLEWDEQENPLAGVTITIPSEHDCQPTISDAKGQFRLCFSEHHVGDVVREVTARKRGYEVVNIHVTRSWTLTTADTLAIIMAPKAKLKEARSHYYGMTRLMELNGLWLREGNRAIEVESPLFTFHINRYGYDMEASDVDVDVPTTDVVNDKMFAVIVANEYYQQEQNVPYAIHDGEMFMEYCLKTLGIPKDHVHFVTDATLNNIRFEVDYTDKNMKEKIKTFKNYKDPYILVLGSKEAEEETVSINIRGNKQLQGVPLEKFLDMCLTMNRKHTLDLIETL